MEILSMKKFWKVAAIVAVAAIPIIILGRRKTDEKALISGLEDDSDIFDRELSTD
jgi:hypothetical protein